MKTTRLLTITLLSSLLPLTSAWGATSGTGTTVYTSGILVLAFAGVCALVVVLQMIPAIMTLMGMIKGVMGAPDKSKIITATDR